MPDDTIPRSRTITIAAVQMIAQPAPTSQRLERAEKLVAQAAQDGAQLVVLPELFNTGYEYSNENYTRAELLEGPTVRWMKSVSAHCGVHLAGSLLLQDSQDIYNAMLLVAPDSRLWRYDKHYPWVWERAYFRAGRSSTVAETDLGRLGLMICWDIAHPEWWECYAGKVDAIVIASCPPTVHDMTFVFPDGQRVRSGEAGPVARNIKQTSSEIFGARLRCQATHLGVPVVNATGTGRFSTALPLPRLSFALYATMNPLLWRHLAYAKVVRVETGYFNETYVADASGRVLAHVPLEQEDYIIAQVVLVDSLPQLKSKQPPFGIHPAAYLFDVMANVILAPMYRQKMRLQISNIKSQIYG